MTTTAAISLEDSVAGESRGTPAVKSLGPIAKSLGPIVNRLG